MNKVRVRIAPSPTGYFHIGTARTALFNWLYAKKNNGQLILRIDDTDKERSEDKYEKDIEESLKWLGIDWDEKYYQSKRIDIYKGYLVKLLKSKKAFWCYHTKEELESESKIQRDNKEAPRHICEHKRPSFAKATKGGQATLLHQGYEGQTDSTPLNTSRQAGLPQASDKRQGGVVRLAVDEDSKNKIKFNDEVRGEIEWSENLIGDFVIAKDIDNPLYNFVSVVDDIDMSISHIIRGEDHISNTPRQILIYQALNKDIPKFAHLPLILGTDKSKLSKRHGAVSISDYKKDYLSKAIVNFLGFIGFTYDKELLDKEDMAKEFSFTKVHKAGAIFDIEKLNWINAKYIKRLPPVEFKELIDMKDLSNLAVPLITERLDKLSDVHNFNYLWEEPKYDEDLLKWKKATLDESKSSLRGVVDVLKKTDFDSERLRESLDNYGKNLNDRGLAYWPLRVALTGREKSPDPVDIALVLGKEKTLKRLGEAIKYMY